ncbi:hypothetical protein GCM10011613_28420 [Cellvibrio zantedeschiae]|uniref:Uncharacterized protein n=1 Tax=Cellvibrio zantedeschiae TaxID=1237077 RepID=A0ABQ3B7G5_9GAMM|nr:hypothetical protein [Cellvibrio zantedeschiae]GGY82031.1 hypothetical protein GCM10011613_28420 [Cellvibrio zantedeschiae]
MVIAGEQLLGFTATLELVDATELLDLELLELTTLEDELLELGDELEFKLLLTLDDELAELVAALDLLELLVEELDLLLELEETLGVELLATPELTEELDVTPLTLETGLPITELAVLATAELLDFRSVCLGLFEDPGGISSPCKGTELTASDAADEPIG